MDTMFPAHRNTVSKPSRRTKDSKEMALRGKWKRGVDRTGLIERSNQQ